MTARPTFGRRIVVTGLAGSGKSTMATAIGRRLQLPVVHLDLHFWQPGWVAPAAEQWLDTQRSLLAGDSWVADGNYSDTLPLRLQLADTVVVLDTPWWRCVGRALRRGLTLPAELPPGCEFSRRHRFVAELGVAWRTFRKRNSEPTLERSMIEEHGGHARVHVARSRREVSELLEHLPPEPA